MLDTSDLLLSQGSSPVGDLCVKRRVSPYSRLTIHRAQKPATINPQLCWKLVLMSFSVHQTVGWLPTVTTVASGVHHVLGDGGHPSSLLPREMPMLPNTCPYLASLSDGEETTPSTMSRPSCQHLLDQKAVVTVLSMGTSPFPSTPLSSREAHPWSLFPLSSGSSSTKGQHLHVHRAAGKRLFVQKCSLYLLRRD